MSESTPPSSDDPEESGGCGNRIVTLLVIAGLIGIGYVFRIKPDRM